MDQQMQTPSAASVTPPPTYHKGAHGRRVLIFVLILAAVLAAGYFWYEHYLKMNARPLTPEEQKAAIINHLEEAQINITPEQKNQVLMQIEASNKEKAAAEAKAKSSVSDKDKQAILNNLGQ